jgi:hypothetical protein
MKTWLQELVMTTNGRPFSTEEIMRLSAAVEALPDRLAAIRKMEDCQKWLVRQLSEHIAPRAAEWGLPKDPFSNDFVNLLTALSHAVLSDDVDLVSTTIVKPCQQLAAALELDPSEFGTLFEVAWMTISQRCESHAISPLKPFFQKAMDELKISDWVPSSLAAIPTETREFAALEV